MRYASRDPVPISPEQIRDVIPFLPEKQRPYRVQSDLTLRSIDYSLYVLDSSQETTLTLPYASDLELEQGNIITLLNPTKDHFIINGNGVNIVKSGVQYPSITLTEYQSLKLVLLDIGRNHDLLWYELIHIPVGVGGYVHPSTHPAEMIIEDTNHNFITLTEKGNIHAPGSDNQVVLNQSQIRRLC